MNDTEEIQAMLKLIALNVVIEEGDLEEIYSQDEPSSI